jgi:hypothetical protein
VCSIVGPLNLVVRMESTHDRRTLGCDTLFLSTGGATGAVVICFGFVEDTSSSFKNVSELCLISVKVCAVFFLDFF